ncbi:MAG: hypothetical protein FWF71_02625 [Actinomycetia bacterium]|nr:hypothetical protein [Actinomycetes bacterium]
MPLIDYKCPNCGGKIEFDSALQEMKCPYCDSTFDVSALKDHDLALNAPTDESQVTWQVSAQQWASGEQEGMMVYSCNSCGGEIIGDSTLAATSCPYCGNPVIMSGQFSGSLKPSLIIPFKTDKKQALAALKQHYQDKPLLPKAFKDDNFISEIKGVYVPFWLFDATCEGDALFDATTSNVWSDGKLQYTETKHYSVQRTGSVNFALIPVDGSSRLADELMESIEPFDYSALVDFQTAYLAGYFADKYDMDADACIPRAEQRMRDTTAEILQSSVQGYSSVTTQRIDIAYQQPKTTYALFPVWLLSTVFQGKTYTFAMNGQTGRFVGDLPVDTGLYWRWFAMVGGIAAVIVFVIFALLVISGVI